MTSKHDNSIGRLSFSDAGKRGTRENSGRRGKFQRVFRVFRLFRVFRVLLVFIIVMMAACAQKMAVQPKYEPLAPSAFFNDGRSARPLVRGTVARGYTRENPFLYSGPPGASSMQNTAGEVIPPALTLAMVERGRERFNIYCSVCHGLAGYGDGMIVERGFSRPPSFHDDRLRGAPARHFFDVITQGFGAMPSYQIQTTVEDRWAIIAYIRALQLSQRAPLAAAPPDVRQNLEAEGHR